MTERLMLTAKVLILIALANAKCRHSLDNAGCDGCRADLIADAILKGYLP